MLTTLMLKRTQGNSLIKKNSQNLKKPFFKPCEFILAKATYNSRLIFSLQNVKYHLHRKGKYLHLYPTINYVIAARFVSCTFYCFTNIKNQGQFLKGDSFHASAITENSTCRSQESYCAYKHCCVFMYRMNQRTM